MAANSDISLDAMCIEKAELGTLVKIAEGGQAIIYRLPDLHLGDDVPLVAKLYRSKVLPIPRVGLARLVKFRMDQDPKVRAQLDRYYNWPIRVVIERGQAVGCVVPLLLDRFFHDFTSLTGRPSRRVVEVQHLFVPESRNRQVGLAHANHTQRLSVCYEAARAYAILHSTGMVYGDMNARNLLVSLRPHPTVVFVEGDALRRSGSSAVVPQVQTPDWFVPEMAKAQSEQTDCYKLGLLILRTLTPGPGSSINRDPETIGDKLDRDGRQLLRRALGNSRDHRPHAREWANHFRETLIGRRAPRPEVGDLTADTTTSVTRVDADVTKGDAWVRRNGKWEPR